MRRKAAKIRKIFPDAKYKEVIVSRFVNRLMNDGKKSVVEKAIYDSFNDLEKKLKRSPIDIFKEALEVITSSSIAMAIADSTFLVDEVVLLKI
jgi:small subunit ribosomal protein S7